MAGATSLVDQRLREVVIVFVIASPRLLTLRKYHAESSIECLRFDGTRPDHSSNNICRLPWHVQSTVVPAHGTQRPETPLASRYHGYTSLRPLTPSRMHRRAESCRVGALCSTHSMGLSGNFLVDFRLAISKSGASGHGRQMLHGRDSPTLSTEASGVRAHLQSGQVVAGDPRIGRQTTSNARASS